MHHPRFYVEYLDAAATVVELRAENLHHLRDVLRLGVGEIIMVFDAGRKFVQCEIERVGRDAAVARVERSGLMQPPSLHLHLGLALLQPQKIELVLQKAAEWGVSKLTPLISRRSRSLARHKSDRWQRIAIEAACQSESAIVLRIDEAAPLPDFVAHQTGLRLLLDEEGGTPLRDFLRESNPVFVTVLVGPEGGWDRGEVAETEAHGFLRASLGPHNLRSETAAISAVALLMHQWGMGSPRA
ncbi:MAG: RsmE family RNA methyltransferase [Acidobacteriota bacterium]